jgi:hypothetical protein
MTPQELRGEIERAVNVLIDVKLAVDANPPILRRFGSDVLLTWPTQAGEGAFTDNQFGTIQEYRRLVLTRQYTCAFVDGALVQISFTFRGDDVIANRLCYYPCPLVLEAGVWDPTEIPLLDLFDSLVAEEFDEVLRIVGQSDPARYSPRLRMRGPIRFEYAPEQRADDHPASHMHLGREEARLPVFGPLSFGHFLRFIVRHHYPEFWTYSAVLRGWRQTTGTRCIAPADEEGLFIDCRARIMS